MAAMALPIATALLVGLIGASGYWIGAGMLIIYGMVIWLVSSSLTAGATAAADPARRGVTLAVHSALGYAGGFVGPRAIGWPRIPGPATMPAIRRGSPAIS